MPPISDLGTPPAPQHAVPPAGEPSSDIPLWVIFVAVALMLALTGVVAALA
ncbi:MAG: hypothetical protein ABI873_13165 [Marmoricola sp.]